MQCPKAWSFLLSSVHTNSSISDRASRLRPLPDAAHGCMHHRLSGFAAKCLCKLRHVPHGVVQTKFRNRVRVGCHLRAYDLRARTAAPIVCECQKETLHIGEAVT